jgi:hypothetical protein
MSGSATMVQDHYRVRRDNATVNGTPTWLAAEDSTTGVWPGYDVPFCIRFVLSNTGTAASGNIIPRYSHNGGAYTAITTSSSVVRSVDVSVDADATAIPTANFLLTAGTGVAADGATDEGGSNTAVTNGNYKEHEFSFLIRSEDVADGDTIAFRLYNGTSAFTTYSVTPTITADATPAFGDSLGALSVTGTSITDPFVAAGSVVVAADDLIVAVLTEQTSLTVTSVDDNLGNTYTPTNDGSDAGAVTGRAFYSIVTAAGTLTAVNAQTTASSDNAAMVAVALKGPVSAIDKNPANTTNDLATPYPCPATGTLAQADELIVHWASGTVRFYPVSPSYLRHAVGVTGASVNIGAYVVAATTDQTPSFTGIESSADVLGTITFKKTAAGTNLSPAQGNLTLSTTAPTAARTDHHSRTPAAGNLTLSTTAPTASQNINRNPASANLVLSTTAPTVAQTTSENKSPASANLVLSTTAPTLAQTTSENKSPASANLVLSATAPTVTQNINRNPAAANLVLSTTAPTREVSGENSFNLSPATANLVLSTTAPSLVQTTSENKSPAAANLVLSTTAPTAARTTSENKSPAAANLVLSTTAPSLAQTTSENKSPAAANLVLSTTAPTVNVGSAAVKTPATAQLTLSTTAPTLAVSDNRNLAPASANLTLSTTAPTLAVSSTGECIPLFQPNVFQNNVFQVCVEEEGGQKDGDPDYWRLPWFHVEGESAHAKAAAELRDKVLADLERAFGLAESGTPAKAKKAARKAAKEIKALARAAGALLSDDAINALDRVAEDLRYSASQWSRHELMARSNAARMALLAIEAEMHDEEEALLVLMLAA